MHLVYTVLLFVYFLAVLPATAYGIWRRGREPGSLRERFGRLPAAVNPDRRPSVWVHAVSVGEALAARPLLRALRAAYPAHRLVVSTTTATGQRVACGFGRDVDAVCYAPFDFPWFVDRALDRIAPALLLVVDTEIWPNLLRACRRRGVGALIVNGRLSDVRSGAIVSSAAACGGCWPTWGASARRRRNGRSGSWPSGRTRPAWWSPAA